MRTARNTSWRSSRPSNIRARNILPLSAEEDEASEELEVSILKSVTEDGEDLLVAVEDEDELAAVYDLLMQSLYEDEEEAEDEEE